MRTTDVETADDLAVCMRTFIRSNGCPTSTTQMPPTPPDRKLLRAEAAAAAMQKVKNVRGERENDNESPHCRKRQQIVLRCD
jgi:hypothetical protein